MKQLSFLIIASFQILFYASCTSSKKAATLPVVTIALSNSEEGTILVRSSGQGESEAKAVANSEIKAFNTLLFYGYPSSVQTRPMIENETEAKRLNSKFFSDFFENAEYKSFIINSYNYAGVQKEGKLYYPNRDIKINLRSLRTHLENKGIIRKFGY